MTTLIIALVAYLLMSYSIGLCDLFRGWYHGMDFTLGHMIRLLVVPIWLLVALANVVVLWFATTRGPELIERWSELTVIRGRRGARFLQRLQD